MINGGFRKGILSVRYHLSLRRLLQRNSGHFAENIKEAEYQSKAKVDELNSQIVLKEKELEDLKKQFDVYKAKMESLLISQLELLKDIKED